MTSGRLFRGGVLGAALLVVALAACGPQPQVEETGAPEATGPTVIQDPLAPPEGQILRGHLILGPEEGSFQPCGEEVRLRVVDRTSGDMEEAYRQLAGDPGRPLYVEIRGLRDPSRSEAAPGGTLTVLQLRQAAIETLGCDEDLAFEVEAFGNEPFWKATLSEGTMTYSAPPREGWPTGVGEMSMVCYEMSGVEDGRRVFLSVSLQFGEMEITLTEERCIDTMSGAWFHLSAKVRYLPAKGDYYAYFGCAREGTLKREPAPGN